MRSLCIALALFAFACDHDHNSYSTFQACFDEHTMSENLPFQEAVVVCCLDHPIGGVSSACGATAPECVTYLTANLTSSATTTEIEATCAEYIRQKGM